MEEVLSDIINSLSSIAKELGKVPPQLNIVSDSLRIHKKAYDLFTNVFSHLLRNSVDHGIELPEERKAAGKNEQGNIEINVQRNEHDVEIILRDDGKGINLARLHQKGIENGLWSESDQPKAEDIAALMFHSGVSTKEQVSSISGRGVGMDAVKQFLLGKGGDISLKLLSEKNQESDFVGFETHITLPASFFVAIQ